MKNIIFLDIDGVVIPETSLFWNPHASLIQKFCKQSLMFLQKILKDCPDCKLVFNTTHNSDCLFDGLVTEFVQAGFANYIHPDCRTGFPNQINNRLDAIKEWLKRHPEINEYSWVAFDDSEIDDARAFLVNGEFGLGPRAYLFASEMLNFDCKVKSHSVRFK